MSTAAPGSFFVLESSTSLFAGIPGKVGRGDGPAEVASFNCPQDLVVDANQQLFIADTLNARIRRISKQGKVSTIASISGGDGEIENFPNGLAFDHKGALYILQGGKQHHIFQISAEGRVSQLAGAETIGHTDIQGNLYKAEFNFPRATGVDSKNRLYVCERGNNAVRRVDLEVKSVITLLDEYGSPLDLLAPEGITVDQNDEVYVADSGHHRILKLTPKLDRSGKEVFAVSNYCGKYGEAGYANGEKAVARLNRPTGLAIDKQNHLWICDSGNNW